MKRIILLIIAVAVTGCASQATKEGRRKSAQLYPGMAQSKVVRIFEMPDKTEGKPSGTYFKMSPFQRFNFERRNEDQVVWEYDKIDLTITFIQGQAGWVVKDWKID
jgi:hypothetical protein